ncbi:tRNA (adenosine(37)-N6)-threonylcarbamoyltransferase complex ATPase subunit type 1 TsaE [Streptomyces sp. RB110-1]|uniref:tRNA (adenosine(37)-N6)-threonylcarbamoyltransferase complex ATPase subunit type 1 TsaE n=1 Tax=unclassified Streptomyces TaxID=2593676 RepID=UPI0019001C39|nr:MULTISPECIES: tRNA (adenosine(37)-N6)-threonylcarbamoyltransferase complex ATPase subunit type 1 TsaE [unclassified Streptomyces]MBK0374950.1 tRNA (adenosine(37)-N6)-threonylcarbamoyltransferase complex ATPase subunit type 1 TsaE [Streptomyces sp. RB110-1]MBK0388680.1 tRNA (adenosine(37)-N6)-threonylcarbamoyltransferase complex ATPase subunit type 1 TsaE [Streptomyces sp. RB110-2]
MEAPHNSPAAETAPDPAGTDPASAPKPAAPDSAAAPASTAPESTASAEHGGPAAGFWAVPEAVTVTLTVTSPEQMQELGRRLARVLAPGDLVMLTGELGAGKTTLTRGLGEGLGVRGAVTSPTFVIARVHPSLSGGPALVHVDAYRLGGGLDEMEDLDLDVSLPESVVVVEWGDGKVEELSDDRLRVLIDRATGDTDDERREVTLVGIGARWAGLREALG